MRPYLALTAVLLSGATARAQTVAVVELSFGDSAPALREQVRAQIEQGLKGQGYRVLLPEQVAKGFPAGDRMPACRIGPCLSRFRSAVDADRVLIGGVSGQGSSYDLTFTLLESDGGTVLSQVNDHCDVCTFREASEAVGRAIPLLHELARRYVATQSWLIVRSEPTGAVVRLDGVPLGKTPLRRLVAAGARALEVRSQAMGMSAKRELRLVAGQTKEVDLYLQLSAAVPQPALEPADAGSSRPWLSWLTFGAGVSMTILGSVLLGVNDDCLDEPQCSESRNTRLPGAVFATAGLASLVVSGVLFWRDQRRRAIATSGTTSAVGVALDGSTVGLSYSASY